MRPLIPLIAAACASAAIAQAPPHRAVLKSASGQAAGSVVITPAPKGMLLTVDATGLTPGWHAIHVHEKGDCSDVAFKAAGGHVHAGGASVHGLLNPAANDTGDLPNIYADAAGNAHAELFTPLLTEAAITDADGAAIVIHANRDDYTSQPIGGAGARVSCGVIS